jgi:hypothetical protein
MSSFLTPNYPPPKRKSKEEMIAESGSFVDERSSIAGEKPKFDWNFFSIAMAVMVIIFGVIIGTFIVGSHVIFTGRIDELTDNALCGQEFLLPKTRPWTRRIQLRPLRRPQ